jgi:16S rRNA (cytidine1402-2'-O)-methyltransferase
LPGFQIRNQRFDSNPPEPGLYVVATPIGNLGDITIRALEILSSCDLIACEDTRVTAKLLRHFNISTKTIPYHEHNASSTGPKLLARLEAGETIAVVSDAGMPLVSDPGHRLVEQALERDIAVHTLPGATAPVTALVGSGLPSDTFIFAGFLPSKQGARLKRLETFASTPATLVYFESPNRLAKTLADMAAVYGSNRDAAVARELTKLHEEIVRKPLGDLLAHYEGQRTKGEIVILVGPPAEETMDDPDALLHELLETMSVSKAASEASILTGQSKRDLYQRALAITSKG